MGVQFIPRFRDAGIMQAYIVTAYSIVSRSEHNAGLNGRYKGIFSVVNVYT